MALEQQPISYLEPSSRPTLRLPRGACDAHVHIFGPRDRFPYADSRYFTPHEAGKEKLFALHKLLGIDRCVMVQSATHGFDNSAIADAIADKGGAYLGVALLPVDVSDAELRRHHAMGFRGVRYAYMSAQADRTEPVAPIIALSKRLADIGWHLQIQLDPPYYDQLFPALRTSACPVVIDHMGRVDASTGVDHEAFQSLLRVMADEKFRIKVSGSERISKQGKPYRDAIPFGHKLVSEFGDRVLWGTDWPHPNHAGDNIPDDGVLVNLLAEIAPSESQRQALLVDNPARFYGFKNPLFV